MGGGVINASCGKIFVTFKLFIVEKFEISLLQGRDAKKPIAICLAEIRDIHTYAQVIVYQHAPPPQNTMVVQWKDAAGRETLKMGVQLGERKKSVKLLINGLKRLKNMWLLSGKRLIQKKRGGH